jgi:ATP-dependent RNA helicase RhlB
VYGLEPIENLINMKIPVAWAEESEYLKDKSAGIRIHDEKRERRPALKEDRTGKSRRPNKPRQVEKSRQDEKPKHAERQKQHEKAAHSADHKTGDKATGRIQAAPASQGSASAKHSTMKEHTAEQRQHSRTKEQSRKIRHIDEKRQKKSGPDRKQSLEDRISYYQKKYGDNFKIAAPSSEPKKRKRTKILETIKGIFSRKKPIK